MPRIYKIIAHLLCFCLFFEQSGFAQIAGSLDIPGAMAAFRNSLIQEPFRPLHLRSLKYDMAGSNFRLLLDKGDAKALPSSAIETTAKILFDYFVVGIALPNSAFWVNLKPDAPDRILDDRLAKTDMGKVLLEADLQLKKDTAKFTSPDMPEGKIYWEKLYQKAAELYGKQDVAIPTMVRPWIVPAEIIMREQRTEDAGRKPESRIPSGAYIYKATLKVMLEQDYLNNSDVYNFKDQRAKTLNEYAAKLAREMIIPLLTQEVNTAPRYAALRQVYYSLIMAQWFKSRFKDKPGTYSSLIDKENLEGLTSKKSWSPQTYFQAYNKSFKDGEYNIDRAVGTDSEPLVRNYISGGIVLNMPFPSAGASPAIIGDTKIAVLPGTSAGSPESVNNIALSFLGGNAMKVSSPVAQEALTQGGSFSFDRINNLIQSVYPGQSDLDIKEFYKAVVEVKDLNEEHLDDLHLLHLYSEYQKNNALYAKFLMFRNVNLIILFISTILLYNYPVFRKMLIPTNLILASSNFLSHLFVYSYSLIFKLPFLNRIKSLEVSTEDEQIDGLIGKTLTHLSREENLPGNIGPEARVLDVFLRDDISSLSSDLKNSLGKTEFQTPQDLTGLIKLLFNAQRKPRRWWQGNTNSQRYRYQRFLSRLIALSLFSKQGATVNYLALSIIFILQEIAAEGDDRDIQDVVEIMTAAQGDLRVAMNNQEVEITDLTDHFTQMLVGAWKTDSEKDISVKRKQFQAVVAPLAKYIFTRIQLTNKRAEGLSLQKTVETSVQNTLASLLAQEDKDMVLATIDALWEEAETRGIAMEQIEELVYNRVLIADRIPDGRVVQAEYEPGGVIHLTPLNAAQRAAAYKRLLIALGLDDRQIAAKFRGLNLPETKQESQNKEGLLLVEPAAEMAASAQLPPQPALPQRSSPASVSGAAASPAQAADKNGGVDFRALPVPALPVLPMGNVPPAMIGDFSRLDIRKEWSYIQNMVNEGVIPSDQRLRNYLLAACQQKRLARDINQILGLLADVLRLEENHAALTEPGIENMLALLESDRPNQEIQSGLSRISTAAPELQLSIP
ncbi:MAG: hypothetical protein HQL23_06935 [Candidatus Omnitrophica bacterium]|nr:hypothetical protein [Candidatus Omnitrophota bacterium]